MTECRPAIGVDDPDVVRLFERDENGTAPAAPLR